MGTNYYLKNKLRSVEINERYNTMRDTKLPITYSTDGKYYYSDIAYYLDYLEANKIEELTNGYLYNNTYYTTRDLAELDFTEKLHIGKSSFGWRFNLCAYPCLGINTLEDWIKLFNDNEIVNESGDVVSKKEMIRIITERKGEVTDLENCGYGCGYGAWLDEKHGLVGHDKKTHNCDPEVTYDITTRVDFS